jgi:hypothetical protein
MTKDVLITTSFFIGLGFIHFSLQGILPPIQPEKDFYLLYAVLLIVNYMGITLFFLGGKLATVNFAGLFIVFTTIQLLAAMSFALAIKVLRPEDAKNTLLQFVVLFFCNLIFQTIYYVRKSSRENLS